MLFVIMMLFSFSTPVLADVQAAAQKPAQDEQVSEERPSLEGYNGEKIFEQDDKTDELLDS